MVNGRFNSHFGLCSDRDATAPTRGTNRIRKSAFTVTSVSPSQKASITGYIVCRIQSRRVVRPVFVVLWLLKPAAIQMQSAAPLAQLSSSCQRVDPGHGPANPRRAARQPPHICGPLTRSMRSKSTMEVPQVMRRNWQVMRGSSPSRNRLSKRSNSTSRSGLTMPVMVVGMPAASSMPYRRSPPCVLANAETSARNSRLSASAVPGKSRLYSNEVDCRDDSHDVCGE